MFGCLAAQVGPVTHQIDRTRLLVPVATPISYRDLDEASFVASSSTTIASNSIPYAWVAWGGLGDEASVPQLGTPKAMPESGLPDPGRPRTFQSVRFRKSSWQP